MPRFVILRHTPGPDSDRPLHWDLMLEDGGVLKTWALPEPPADGLTLECLELADHRPDYLDYEGPISEGRGEVTSWDRGSFEWPEQYRHQFAIDLRGEQNQFRAIFARKTVGSTEWVIQFVVPDASYDPQ